MPDTTEVNSLDTQCVYYYFYFKKLSETGTAFLEKVEKIILVVTKKVSYGHHRTAYS